MKPANGSIKIHIFLACLVGSLLYIGTPTTVAEAGEAPYIDFPSVIDNADAVVVGKLVPISPPCYMVGLNFYRIEIDEVLKGNFNNDSLLVVVTGVDSSELRAILETEIKYLFSLKKGYSGTEKVCGEFTLFSPFRNWRGIVSLDRKASERRAVKSIERCYGIFVPSVSNAFLDAVRFAIVAKNARNFVEPVPLSVEGAAVFNALRF